MSFGPILKYTYNQNKGVKLTILSMGFLTGDNKGHTFQISVVDNKGPVDLSGAGVTGWFIPNDKNLVDDLSVPLVGSVFENVAIVSLPPEAYIETGRFSIVIKLHHNESVSTIFWGAGNVTRSNTDSQVDIGGVIPSLDDLLAQIARLEAAIEEANEATENANSAARHAPYIDASTNNWYIWDAVNGMYVDTGVNATGPQGPQGANGEGSGSVVTVTVNGETYEADETGDVNLGTIAGGEGDGVSSVTINGTTYQPDENGNVDLGAIAAGEGGIASVTINGTKYTPDASGDVAATVSQIRRGVVYAQPYNDTAASEYGLQMINNQDTRSLYLLTLLASPDVLYYQATGGSRRAVYSEGNPPPYPVKTATINGKSYTPDANGNIDLGTIEAGSGSVSSVTINGTKYTPDASGDVAATVSQVKRGVTNLQPYNNNAVTEYGLQAYNSQTGKSLYVVIRDAAPNVLRIISANTSQDVYSTLNPQVKTATVTFAFNGESLWHYAKISGVTKASQIISILSINEGFWATGLIYDNTLGILTQFRNSDNVYAYSVEAQVAYMV